MKLVIGNKCYSSWSLRPWAVLTHFDIAFEEILLPLWTPEFATKINTLSPSGKVPVLIDQDITIWDSLAIIEYLAEQYPSLPLWPADKQARALARCISAEMHSGFAALRTNCPMNLGVKYAPRPRGEGIDKDIARIETLWRTTREKFGAEGPFLFGGFTAADAMFLPVATRIETYSLNVADDSRAYVDALLQLRAFQAWREAGIREVWHSPNDEVDEKPLAVYRKDNLNV
jgi:glutathione S-transferase